MLTKNYEIGNVAIYLPQAILINLIRAILVLIVRFDVSAIKGTIKAFGWYIENFATTIKERQEIQRKRIYKDEYLFPRIMVKENLVDIYRKNFRQTKLLPL